MYNHAALTDVIKTRTKLHIQVLHDIHIFSKWCQFRHCLHDATWRNHYFNCRYNMWTSYICLL